MLNLLKKTTPWMVASLFVATSVFGQDNGTKPCAPKCEPKTCPPKPCPKPCPQPCPPTQVCPGQDPCCPPWATPVLNAAYSYPARTQTRCPWDLYFDASFIYWQPVQDNLELAISNTNTDVATTGVIGNIVNMSASYKPGFKVGAGMYFDHDNWDVQLMYTWFHQSQHNSATAAEGGTLLPMRGHPTSGGANSFDSINQRWRLNMDIADIDLGRWYYVGTKLTFRPNFGARGAWIRQALKNTSVSTIDTQTLSQRSHSWAVGLKSGLDANWMIGSGFRFYSCGEADLLFTKYTRLSFNQSHTNTDVEAVGAPVKVKQRQVYAVRPHLDLELGIGWGTYLDCNNWYMDFTAGYGFQVFFDQNMFRNFNDDLMVGNSTMPNGNLYIQGLTTTFRLDF